MSSDNQLRTIFSSITKNINEDMDDFTPLKSTCKKFNLEPSHVVLVGIAVILLLTVFGIFQHIFVTLFGLLYPAYMSFKVQTHLSRPSTTNRSRNQSAGWHTGSCLGSSRPLTRSWAWSCSSCQVTTSWNAYSTSGCSTLALTAPRWSTKTSSNPNS